MVDANLIIDALIGTAILAAIALIGSNWSTIVSIFSSAKRQMSDEGAARRAYRQRVYDMSTSSRSHIYDAIVSSRRSDAVEQGWEPSGSEGGNSVPALWEQLGTLTDDELLDILARVKDSAGNPKFADSRIAKFVGGRVEDRTQQVRDVRGSAPPPPKPAAVLRVRDNGIERLIAKYGDKSA